MINDRTWSAPLVARPEGERQVVCSGSSARSLRGNISTEGIDHSVPRPLHPPEGGNGPELGNTNRVSLPVAGFAHIHH